MVFRASLGFLGIGSIYRKWPVLEIREDSPQRWDFSGEKTFSLESLRLT